MHVGCMSVLQLHSFAAVRYIRLPSVLANVRVAREALRKFRKRQIESETADKESGIPKTPRAVKRRLQGKQVDPLWKDLNFL